MVITIHLSANIQNIMKFDKTVLRLLCGKIVDPLVILVNLGRRAL